MRSSSAADGSVTRIRGESAGRSPERGGAAVDELVAQELRRRMAEQYGVHGALVKPCVACIPPAQEGLRGYYCHLIAVEMLRAGAKPERVLAELGAWAERCAQPPRNASHAFTGKEVAATVKSVLRTQERGGLRGFGCRRLADFCVYGGDRRACDYWRALTKPRSERVSLLSVLDLDRSLRAPAEWREKQEQRRRWLMLHIAALEVVKGYPGGNLVTSEAELAWRAGSNRRTLRRDLDAMRTAGWIDFAPGESRSNTGGHPARGCVVRRRFPDDRE